MSHSTHTSRCEDYLALCYHYIRPAEPDDSYPRLLGTREPVFLEHIEALTERFVPFSMHDARAVSYGTPGPSGRRGILLTFDDGLSDHFRAAEILAASGISAIFFIPTCIVTDQTPANPTIIHYCLSIYTIDRFVQTCADGLDAAGGDPRSLDRCRVSDPWQAISAIKRYFKYEVHHAVARATLLHVYDQLLAERLEDGLATMHLTPVAIHQMLQMGHFVGVHSHSHVSIGGGALDMESLTQELITPRKALEEILGVPVRVLSYPFGSPTDCLDAEGLLRVTREYEMAFTVEEIVNTRGTSPLQLGRYMPMSTDDAPTLLKKLQRIEEKANDAAHRSHK